MFDSSTAIHYPHDMDISYEPSNNYTVRSRDPRESRSAEGKRQFYAAGHHRGLLAIRWQPPFPITICPTKSTAADLTPVTLDAGRYPSKVKLDPLVCFIDPRALFRIVFEEARALFRITFLLNPFEIDDALKRR